MDRSNLSIATITRARNGDEEQLLRQALPRLSALGIPVYSSDKESDESFVNYLKGLPGFLVVRPSGSGLWAQVNAALLKAYEANTQFILYTEPDKTDFFSGAIADFISSVNINEAAGMVLASRSEKAFATFPAFQQDTETTINNCCAEMTGHRFDYSYGPFILDRNLVPRLQVLPADIGWGWRTFAFAIAHRLGFQVSSFVTGTPCPPSQQQDSHEERMYRVKQLSENIKGLVLAADHKM